MLSKAYWPGNNGSCVSWCFIQTFYWFFIITQEFRFNFWLTSWLHLRRDLWTIKLHTSRWLHNKPISLTIAQLIYCCIVRQRFIHKPATIVELVAEWEATVSDDVKWELSCLRIIENIDETWVSLTASHGLF